MREEEDEEENEFYKEEFIASVQDHLIDNGRVVIACFYREKFRYMGAEKLIITKTSHDIDYLFTDFMDIE